MKYRIEKSEGCTAYYTQINDKLLQDLSEYERTDFTDYLLQKIGEGLKDNIISLEAVLDLFQCDEYKYDGSPCDQCGDSVTKTIWRI